MTVYVIQCQQTFNVKIGYTSRIIQARLAELRTAASTPIELVKWYPRYTEADEQALHEVFARYRVTGEWFKSDVLTLIDHEIQLMGGAKDYEVTAPNGAAIAPAAMTVNVAVLKIGTQNMKQSFFKQLPWTCISSFVQYARAEELRERAKFVMATGKLWGKVQASDGTYLLYETDESLIRVEYYIDEHKDDLFFLEIVDNAQQLFLV